MSCAKWLGAIFCLVGVIPCELLAQLDFETAPIDYHKVAPRDPVSGLADQLTAGDLRLEWDRQFGWLPAVLDALYLASGKRVDKLFMGSQSKACPISACFMGQIQTSGTTALS